MAVVLVVAVVLGFIGLTIVAHSRAPQGTVFRTDVRGPKVTFDGRPRLERGPRFRVMVGHTRKSARWVTVNPVQYASCSAGNTWNGRLCAKAALHLPVGMVDGRHVVLLGIGCAVVAAPVISAVIAPRRPRP